MTDFQFLGPYRLEARIGQGGMGSVFRAVHDKSGEAVAVKLIAEPLSDSERFRRRFATEVETLKKLEHPSIVRLIGYGEEQGRLFYAMELVEGPSLQQLLRDVKRLDWRETLRIGIDICGALKHAHDLGVIHRDLKPANLLLPAGGPVKLVDFGIAKLFGSSDFTVAGSVLGTADYMAPEQAGSGTISPRTDLYALGSVLYACLAGRPPFFGKQLTQVIDSLRRDPPPPLEMVAPEAPAELTELIHHLLEKSPERRPPTALVVGNRMKAMRAGLEHVERTRTASSTGGSTKVDQLSREAASDSKTAARTGTSLPTSDRLTLDATLESHAAVPRPPRHDTAPSSLAAAEDDAAREVTDTVSPPPNSTTYQPVDSRRRGQPLGDASETHSGGGWMHWLSIAGLLALLLLAVGLTIRMTRPPTADELFTRIGAAAASGRPESAQNDIAAFLRTYPDDPRADQIRLLDATLDVQRTVRRLQLAAVRRGGIQRLDPARQAFLEAMLVRENDPAQARTMLQHWLHVFGHPNVPASPEVARLADLARAEISALSPAPEDAIDRRAEELLGTMRRAEQHLSPEQQRQFYVGVIELYGDKEWALEAVEHARAAMEQLVAPDDSQK